MALSSGDTLEIVTLGLPTKANGYISVSMYSSGANTNKAPVNARGTAIAKKCGYPETVVYGDAFIGRVYDNEEEEWMRRDFLASEAHVNAAWAKAAGQANAGRNMGSYSSAGNFQNQMNQMQKQKAGGSSSAPEQLSRALHSWTQTNDEVEVNVPVPKGTRSKDVAVVIKSNKVGVTLKKDGPKPGDPSKDDIKMTTKGGSEAWGKIDVDSSAWTIEDSTVCVTLCKQKEGEQWAALFKV
jgi:hypothetical protein